MQQQPKSGPTPKAKAPIFPEGQAAALPRGLPIVAKTPPKYHGQHQPPPKTAAGAPRAKERGETAMADQSLRQHFFIPGNHAVLALATDAQRRTLRELELALDSSASEDADDVSAPKAKAEGAAPKSIQFGPQMVPQWQCTLPGYGAVPHYSTTESEVLAVAEG